MKVFISTAIPYVNAKPHIGHAFELVQTDVLARIYRMMEGYDVFFLTGSDENSLKNVLSAKKEGIPTAQLVEKNAALFRDLAEKLNASNDDFIRTTEERHIKGAQKLWSACKKEDIYEKEYEGLYCVGCEDFYKEKDLTPEGLCPEHMNKPEAVKEKNWFFHLSNYQKQLEDLIQKDEIKIIPETKKNEVFAFINGGLEDFSISRSNERAENWGIPVPGDESQIMYVWFDALSNYITALGYASDDKNFQEYWQEGKSIHDIGKGILRFHAIYWPAMLLSAGVKPPNEIFVHGYLTVGGQKISKSLGNVVDPAEMIQKYGADALRYFLMSDITPFEDGDFSEEKLRDSYNELANNLGNLVMRVAKIAQKENMQKVVLPKDANVISKSGHLIMSYSAIEERYFQIFNESCRIDEMLRHVWKFYIEANQAVDRDEPWKKSREEKEAIIAAQCFALVRGAGLLRPFIPETSKKIFEMLGVKEPEMFADTEKIKEINFDFKKIIPLFPRLEKEVKS